MRFDESDVRAMGRPAAGVTGARFKRDGDEVIDMIIVPNGEDSCCHVLTACVNGYGKRSPLTEYPVKGRGTRGVIDIITSDRNGEVVGMKLVADTDHVMFITEKGILMRTRVSDLRAIGRNTQGVRLIKLDEGDRLVALAKVAPEEEPDPTEAVAPAPEGAAPPEETPPAPDEIPPAPESPPDEQE